MKFVLSILVGLTFSMIASAQKTTGELSERQCKNRLKSIVDGMPKTQKGTMGLGTYAKAKCRYHQSGNTLELTIAGGPGRGGNRSLVLDMDMVNRKGTVVSCHQSANVFIFTLNQRFGVSQFSVTNLPKTTIIGFGNQESVVDDRIRTVSYDCYIPRAN